MDWKFLSKIWRPDTYFLNGKDSYLHKVVVPNRFIRIAPTGRISYSQRLTVTARYLLFIEIHFKHLFWAFILYPYVRCQMDLRKFPLDTQTCPLEIGSFGFNQDELTYSWMASPLSMDDALELAQYQMVTWNHGHKLVQRKSGLRSVIYLKFEFRRAIGFYILQVRGRALYSSINVNDSGLCSPVHHRDELLGDLLAGED